MALCPTELRLELDRTFRYVVPMEAKVNVPQKLWLVVPKKSLVRCTNGVSTHCSQERRLIVPHELLLFVLQ